MISHGTLPSKAQRNGSILITKYKLAYLNKYKEMKELNAK
jgi:hypothetical protein